MAKFKKPIKNEHLRSWNALNRYLLTVIDEEELKLLSREEMAGRMRIGFLKRIHCRLNKVRANRERLELEEKTKCDLQEPHAP